jgi:hypothetical protein
MNIAQILLHSIEEHDQLKLLTGLGYEVFNFNDPTQPFANMRPGIPDAPVYPDLLLACQRKRESHAGESMELSGGRKVFDWAKYDLPDEVIDWMDVLIVHHAEHTFIPDQWDRIKHKRVIWRTVGQSTTHNETIMAPYRSKGLEIVRYSPKEHNIPGYAGQDALIRFYKDPAEWYGWTGDSPVVINITQNLRQRDPYTNWGFWEEATKGLNRLALGPGSEAIGGPGSLSYEDMKAWLRRARCYLYTGTQPASYTLGLIEAMMTGIPVVSIGPEHMKVQYGYGDGQFHTAEDLFEGHEITLNGTDDPAEAAAVLGAYLEDIGNTGNWQRDRAIELFGIETIGRQWAAYLGAP